MNWIRLFDRCLIAAGFTVLVLSVLVLVLVLA